MISLPKKLVPSSTYVSHTDLVLRDVNNGERARRAHLHSSSLALMRPFEILLSLDRLGMYCRMMHIYRWQTYRIDAEFFFLGWENLA